MTLAVTTPSSIQPSVSQTVPIVVLGADALLAALPSTPVQLAHACLRAGFTNVIPASWGDELIAAGVLRRLSQLGNGPAIQCSCPIVAHRLLTVGGDLRPALVTLMPPPVAIARYVRALSQPTRIRITYVGRCPGAIDESIDIRMTPDALVAMLTERHISLDDQPRIFEAVIPPDRRRFRSQPGGLPSAESLWSEVGARTLVEIDGEDFVGELAQQLLTGKNVLIDVAARLGCVCAGAVGDASPREARSNVVALEPPRSTTPVVEEGAPIDLECPVPAVSRTPNDVLAIPSGEIPSRPFLAPSPGSTPFGHRISPVRGLTPVSDLRQSRASSPVNPRPVLGAVPVTRDVEGKSLPRAYVARRRSSPKGIPAISLPSREIADPSMPATRARSSGELKRPREEYPVRHDTRTPVPAATPAEAKIHFEIPASLSLRHLLYIFGAILLLTVSISTIVAVVIGRSLR